MCGFLKFSFVFRKKKTEKIGKKNLNQGSAKRQQDNVSGSLLILVEVLN